MLLLGKSSPLESSPVQSGSSPKQVPWKQPPSSPRAGPERGNSPLPCFPKTLFRSTSLETCKEGNTRPSSLEHQAVAQRNSRSSLHMVLGERQPGLAPKQGELLWVPGSGATTARFSISNVPGGQRPTEYLTAVLHHVAMAVGILHTVLPSPGTLDLQQTGHKIRDAPSTPVPGCSTSRAAQQGGCNG